MRAIVLEKYSLPEELQLKEVEKPTPKNNEVLIKIRAAAVNDWDWCLVRGKPLYIRLLCGFLKPKIQILGAEIAGSVEVVGQNITKFQVGDEVYGDISDCGFGGFAEYVCVPEHALALKPSSMTFVEAAAIPHAAMLAVQALQDEGQIQPGQKLLINGAGGGVGTLGVQIAKSVGVVQVTGVDSSEKLEMMGSIGFDRVIDYRQEDFTQNGQRYDLIIDTKTNRSPFDYMRVLSLRGSYVTVGGSTARLIQALLLGAVIRRFTHKNIRIVSLKPNKDLDYLNELYEAGKVKPIIDGSYKLSEVPKAIQSFGEGKHNGKIVINLEGHSDL